MQFADPLARFGKMGRKKVRKRKGKEEEGKGGTREGKGRG